RGATAFNLRKSTDAFQTLLFDNQLRSLVLQPAPTNHSGDDVDALFTVGMPGPLPVSGNETSPKTAKKAPEPGETLSRTEDRFHTLLTFGASELHKSSIQLPSPILAELRTCLGSRDEARSGVSSPI